jgi:nucleotide-binding universal stress UspA family protein
MPQEVSMIFPARRILVPDDLTDASRPTWAWARVFAAPDARLESLFIYDLPPAPVMGMPVPPLAARAKKTLLERLRRQRPDAASWSLEEGDAVLGILRRARSADLVVVGTHGRTGLSRFAFGSVAEAVMRGCSVPVLAVRSAPKPVRTVLAPINLQTYAYKGLLLAAEAAVSLGAELVLLHVTLPGKREGNPRFFINGLIERLPAQLRGKVRPRLLLRGGDAIPAILEESSKHGLVVLTAHRKSLLGDMVLGTTVERVVRHASVPVLAAPSVVR